MTQLILNIDNPAILPSLKKVLNALDGVSIVKASKSSSRRKSGLDIALEQSETGEITRWETADDLINHIRTLSK